MGTLIGRGAHALDIAATLDPEWRQVTHHRDFTNEMCHQPFIIGVNDPRERFRIAEELLTVRWDEPWVHPSATIGPRCEWGPGTHINYAVSMTRTTLGRHITISPGVTICGDVVIDDNTLIGAGTTICDRVRIGRDCTIGAGTIILPETVVGDGETWVGNPGRRIKP